MQPSWGLFRTKSILELAQRHRSLVDMERDARRLDEQTPPNSGGVGHADGGSDRTPDPARPTTANGLTTGGHAAPLTYSQRGSVDVRESRPGTAGAADGAADGRSASSLPGFARAALESESPPVHGEAESVLDDSLDVGEVLPQLRTRPAARCPLIAMMPCTSSYEHSHSYSYQQ